MVLSVFRITVNSPDSKLSCLALAASICIYCSNIGFLGCFSIFYASLLDKYGESREKTAWVGSIPFALTFALTPFVHYMSAKLSIRLTIVIGTALTGASLIATSFASNLDVVFLTFSLVYGIGSSILFMNTVRAVNLYFDRRFSTALGLMTGGTTLLQIPLTQLVVRLVESYNIQRTLQIYGIASTVICLLCSITYFPSNYEIADKKEHPEKESTIRVYKTLMKSNSFRVWTAVQVIICLEYVVSSVHQVQFAIESGVPEKTAQQFPFYSAIGASIGRCTSGFIFDLKSLDKVYTFQVLLLLTGLVSLIGSISTNQVHLIVFIWLFSALDGSFQSGVFPALRSIVGRHNLNQAIAITLMLSSTTILLGPPVVGLIVDRTKSYKSFFYVAGTPLVIGFLLLFTLRWTKEFKSTRDIDDINEQLQSVNETATPSKEKDQIFLLQFETNV